jgi:hypothetical protein
VTLAKPSFILLLLAALVLFAMSIAAPRIAFTDHALESHSSQVWNAPSIYAAQSSNGCGPVTKYVCPGDTVKYVCADPKDANNLLVFVRGFTSGKIVTGYEMGQTQAARQLSVCAKDEP